MTSQFQFESPKLTYTVLFYLQRRSRFKAKASRFFYMAFIPLIYDCLVFMNTIVIKTRRNIFFVEKSKSLVTRCSRKKIMYSLFNFIRKFNISTASSIVKSNYVLESTQSYFSVSFSHTCLFLSHILALMEICMYMYLTDLNIVVYAIL